MSKRTSVFFISLLVIALISCSAVTSIPNPFATATPTATQTFTPSPTSTLTPTPSFTPTPVPEAFIKQLADESTQFTDLKAGYSVVLPQGWLVINFAVEDPDKALEQAKRQNPSKATLLDQLNTVLQQRGRMGALDLVPDHYLPTTAPMAYVALEQETASMPLQTILDQSGKMVSQILKGKIVVSKVKQNSSGVAFGTIDVTLNLQTSSAKVTVLEELVLFKTSHYTVYITFAALDKLWPTTLPDVQKITDSIETFIPDFH